MLHLNHAAFGGAENSSGGLKGNAGGLSGELGVMKHLKAIAALVAMTKNHQITGGRPVPPPGLSGG